MPTDLESGNNQGAPGQPTQAASGGGSGSQPSNDAEVLYQRLEQSLLSKLEPRLQSLTDKRFKKVENEQTDIRAFMEKVKPYMDKGLTLDQATREVELNEALDFYRASRQGSQPAQLAAAPQQSSTEPAVMKALQKLGLSDTDPEVVAILRDNADAADKIVGLATLGASRKAAPTPNPAINAAPTTGSQISRTLTTADVETKSAELNALYKNPTMNKARISALEKELEPYFK